MILRRQWMSSVAGYVRVMSSCSRTVQCSTCSCGSDSSTVSGPAGHVRSGHCSRSAEDDAASCDGLEDDDDASLDPPHLSDAQALSARIAVAVRMRGMKPVGLVDEKGRSRASDASHRVRLAPFWPLGWPTCAVRCAVGRAGCVGGGRRALPEVGRGGMCGMLGGGMGGAGGGGVGNSFLQAVCSTSRSVLHAAWMAPTCASASLTRPRRYSALARAACSLSAGMPRLPTGKFMVGSTPSMKPLKWPSTSWGGRLECSAPCGGGVALNVLRRPASLWAARGGPSSRLRKWVMSAVRAFSSCVAKVPVMRTSCMNSVASLRGSVDTA